MQDIAAQNVSQLNMDSSIELEKLLETPNKSSNDWQINSARLVALEHNKTLVAETDDFAYMRSLALCRWAQLTGVSEAKKKNLQATRFRSNCPPPLQALEKPNLINAALDLLLSLKGPWCLEYIANLISKKYVDKKGVATLFKWADKSAQSAAEFLKIILSISLTPEVEESRTLLLIKEASSKLNFSKALSNESVSHQVLEAIHFVKDLKNEKVSKKILSALDSLMKAIIEKSRRSHPTVLIHGHFLQSLTIFLENAENKKTAQSIISEQIFSALKILEDLCSFGGEDGIVYRKQILPTLKKLHPNFDKYLEEITKSNPTLLRLKEEDIRKDLDSLEDSAVSIYARLLPSWLDFYTTHSDPSQLSLMHTDLIAGAKLNGIEFLGVTGDSVSFDPVIHKLNKIDQTPSTNVCIVRPAIIFRRTNGTYRIILPAIVDAI